MTSWRPDFNPEHLYFVTTKAVQYAHLFHRDVMKRLMVDTLDCFRSQKRFELYTFVVMPNTSISSFSANQMIQYPM